MDGANGKRPLVSFVAVFFGMSHNAPPKATCVPFEGALRDSPKDGCEAFVAGSDVEVNVKGGGTLRDV